MLCTQQLSSEPCGHTYLRIDDTNGRYVQHVGAGRDVVQHKLAVRLRPAIRMDQAVAAEDQLDPGCASVFLCHKATSQSSAACAGDKLMLEELLPFHWEGQASHLHTWGACPRRDCSAQSCRGIPGQRTLPRTVKFCTADNEDVTRVNPHKKINCARCILRMMLNKLFKLRP